VPVCVPADGSVDYAGVRATAVSFKTDKNGQLSMYNVTKSQMSVTLRGDEQCEMKMTRKWFDPDFKLCSSYGDAQDPAARVQSVIFVDFESWLFRKS
jgi:hypothetical protein